MEKPIRGRHIRSFVLRQGHMSEAQKHAMDVLLPTWGIPYQEAPIDLDAAFGRTAPRVLEIGFGMGATTALLAEREPERDFLGIEVHAPGVGTLLRLLEAQKLTNVRIIAHDAVEAVRDMLPPESFSAVHVFFPDPWPKKRHQKRRLLQPPFVALLASRLAPGGHLHAATDWEDYAHQIRAVFSAEPRLVNAADTASGFATRPENRPLTKFEQRGIGLGHGVWDVILRRV